MGQDAQQTRENRTITIDFQNEAEVIEEFASSACIPCGSGINQMLKPNCRHTPPLVPTGGI